MEASPRLPALQFHCKSPIESVNLCEKIPHYILSHYHENSENYRNECELINRLRQDALQFVVSESTVQILKRYYCQLLLLRNRFPMLPENECAVRFTWEDVFLKEENTFNDIRFEEASILYNLAAIYSKLGANETRQTHESMKIACTYFRCAAACLEKVRDNYPTYSTDLTQELLNCQVDILLGQAHEAVLEKSQMDKRPASVNAHIAMQISEYNRTALANLTKSEVQMITLRRFREWRVALTYKCAYYASLTYYYRGLLADDEKKRGEVVCYFENAIEQLKDAWKSATKISNEKSSIYKEAHTFALELFIEKAKIAKRDNDNIYFEKVPSLTSLPVIKGAIVAKPQMFDTHECNISGPDIFQKLIPLNVHLALSEYSEEKAKLLRDVAQLVEEKDRQLETFRQCLQLDRMPLNNEYLRLPREFLDCFAAAATRPTMPKDFASVMQQLNSQHHDIVEQINESEEFVENFKRNSQLPSVIDELKDIQCELQHFTQLMLKANETNTDLHRHMTTIIEHLTLLYSPLEQLEQILPKIAEFDDETLKPKFVRLGLLCEKFETIKSQREILIKEFRQKLHDDDITKLILIQKEENYKNLFGNQMKKHEEFINMIKQNCQIQEKLIQSVTEINVDLAEVRPKIIKQYENRQRLIQDCVESFKCFDETLSKAYEGMEFYKKQKDKLNIVYKRLINVQTKQQKQVVQRSTSPPVNVTRPRLKDYLPIMKPQTWGSTALTKNDQSVLMSNVQNHFNGYNSTIAISSAPQQANYPSLYSQTLSMPLMTSTIQQAQPTASYSVTSSISSQHMRYSPQTAVEQNSNGSFPMTYKPGFNPNQQFYPQQQPIVVAQRPSYSTSSSIFTSNDPYRPTQQTLTQTNQFDLYRPRPVGAYDIPQVSTSHRHPQDTVYHPIGYIGQNSNPTNNVHSEQNQYVPSTSFANLSINSTLSH